MSEGNRQVLPARPVRDLDAELTEVLAPLVADSFPVQNWTKDAIARSFIDARKFISTVKVLTLEPADAELRAKIIERGKSDNWWLTQETCTSLQIYKFCKWLRSNEGSAFVNEARRVCALEKTAFPGQTAEEVSLVKLLNAQIQESAIKKKALRMRYEADVAEIERQMFLAEKELERKLMAAKAEYSPVSGYVPMDEMEFGEKCYNLYKTDIARRGGEGREEELTMELLVECKARYGNEAVSLHRLEFLLDENRRNELRVWMEDKISELEKHGGNDEGSIGLYRSYLDAAGGSVAPEVRAEVEGARSNRAAK